MIAQAVLEKRVARLEATRPKPALLPSTAVEMARSIGIEPDSWQQRVLLSDKKHLLMLASRQSGKSMTSALLALHQTAYISGSLTLIVSPGERQSKLLLKKVRQLYRRLPDAPAPITDGKLSLELANGSEIHALPGDEATIRGFSDVSLIIEDEAAVVPDELYESVRPMLAVSGGRIVLLSTPRGKRGHFFHEYEDGGDAWHRERVTAADCPRIDPAFLAEERKRAGTYWYAQEYNVQFVDVDDQYFPTDLIEGAVSADIVPFALPAFEGLGA